MEKDKQKKKQLQKYVPLAFSLLVGAVCGILIMVHFNSAITGDKTSGEKLLSIVFLFGGMCFALLFHVLIHEVGHLVFGLLSGYRFSSFRIGNFMWIKENEHLKIKRLSIAGTGGQCLLVPPETADGKTPFALYHLGGSIANLVFALIFFALYLPLGNIIYLSTFLRMLSGFGFALALLNGIPMKLGLVNNDGHNALLFSKDRKALYSFCMQMRIVEQTSKGTRLKDMPEEWFSIPPIEEMKNSMSAALGVFACNRLMDNHLFDEADQLMEQLLGIDSLLGLYRNMLVCDRIYCELIGKNQKNILDIMLDNPQKKFMKSMKKFPSVLRTEHAYALIVETDSDKAARILATFEKVARTYPYSCDIESERELINIANLAVMK